MPPRPKVPVNREAWSRRSKRSGLFQGSPSFYEDIPYKCYRCTKEAVFAAEDQKRAFEDRKEYVWKRRVLCPSCHEVHQDLQKQEAEYAIRWTNSEKTPADDTDFLRAWLLVLTTLPYYSGRKNVSRIAMIRKLLPSEA